MDATKNYYKVLGVAEDATKAEIKSAYRALAKKLHPDRNPGNDKAAARFRRVNEAYSVLGDEKDRTRYDRLRRLGVGLDLAHHAAYDLNDLKEMVAERMSGFGDFFSGFMGGGGDEEGGPKGRDLTYKVTITLQKSILGGSATFTIPALGGGESRKVRVELPPGLKAGQKIKVDGQGRPGRSGGPAGDLYLKIKIKPDPQFRLEEDRVIHTVSLNLKQLVIGTKVEVPTPGGETGTLEIPAGTQPGQKFRLKGQAGPGRDLLVEVQVTVPEDLDGEALEQFESFCKKAGIDG